jgi:hypothetical protein
MQGKPKSALRPETDSALSALDAMWAAVDAALERNGQTTVTERPTDSFTTAEFAAKNSIATGTAKGILGNLLRAGELSMVLVRLPDARGHLVPTQVYTVREKQP